VKRVAIVQSNYIPWKGYFDLVAFVDEFIVYDDMQYTKRDWRNRNQIKTPKGVQWLTIPVKVKGKYYQSIRETEIDGVEWSLKHWQTLNQNYCRAPYFNEIASILRPIYLEKKYTHISVLNRELIERICEYLDIKTKISNSWDYNLTGDRTERLVNLCLQANGSEYVSGPSAKGYMNEHLFADRKIKLTWFDYNNYPDYPQLWGEFTHGVTILDLLFNCGKSASHYMRFVR
jgi:hypothetical protein